MADTEAPTVSGLDTVADERERGLLRLAELRSRVHRGDPSAVAEEALEELQTSYEELQVSEEELRAQSQELAEAYRRLVQERQRYRDLFEHAPVGYLVTDDAGLIRDANATVARMLQVPQQYLRSKPLRLFVADGERVQLSRWLRDIRDADGTMAGRLVLRPREGDHLPTRFVVASLRGVGEQIGTVRWVLHPVDPETTDAAVPADLPTMPSSPATVDADSDRTLSVAVCDPQPLFVRNLDVLLETLMPGRARVAGATDDPAELQGLIDRTDPDLVVLTVPASDGGHREALRRLHGSADGPPVLVLAGGVDGDHDEEVAWTLIEQHVAAVLPRAAAPDAVVGAMLAAASGWTVLGGAVARSLLEAGGPPRRDLRDSLDDDDLELWRWIAGGRSDAEIAADRNVSTRTVKRRVSDLYERLGVTSRVEAATLAGQHRVVGSGDLGRST